MHKWRPNFFNCALDIRIEVIRKLVYTKEECNGELRDCFSSISDSKVVTSEERKYLPSNLIRCLVSSISYESLLHNLILHPNIISE